MFWNRKEDPPIYVKNPPKTKHWIRHWPQKYRFFSSSGKDLKLLLISDIRFCGGSVSWYAMVNRNIRPPTAAIAKKNAMPWSESEYLSANYRCRDRSQPIDHHQNGIKLKQLRATGYISGNRPADYNTKRSGNSLYKAKTKEHMNRWGDRTQYRCRGKNSHPKQKRVPSPQIVTHRTAQYLPHSHPNERHGKSQLRERCGYDADIWKSLENSGSAGRYISVESGAIAASIPRNTIRKHFIRLFIISPRKMHRYHSFSWAILTH